GDIQEGTLILDDDEYVRYMHLYELFRKDRQVEYLDDKQLKERIWYLTCEVLIHREKFKENARLKEKITFFLNELFRPLEEYEFLFRIDRFSIGDSRIDMSGCSIFSFDEQSLKDWGITGMERALIGNFEFAHQTLLLVKEIG